MIENLGEIITKIQEDWETRNAVRDLTLVRSRALIRCCANSIRATHRREYKAARELLTQAKAMADEMLSEAEPFGDIYQAGYTQDALKEMAEAAITLALITGEPCPDPDELGIGYAAYANGLGEAASELRRFALDSLRQGDLAEAERMLEMMDEVYGYLVTLDFPDNLTRGLRRTTDMVRAVLERTRGDVTVAARQDRLEAALKNLDARLDAFRPEQQPADV